MTKTLLHNCTCGRCHATHGVGDGARLIGTSWRNAAGDVVTVTATGLTVTPRGQDPVATPRGQDPVPPVVRVPGTTSAAGDTAALLAEPKRDLMVTGFVMTPKTPDGKGGDVLAITRRGAKPKLEYARPQPHHDARGGQ